MQPLINASYYYDPVIFQQEQTNLFENQWNFAGLTSEVANHNDYLQVNLGSQSIIIHNFSGELKAFQNICTHRFCQIHSESHGNRPLQCPYHGWTFDRLGIPVGIPDSTSFECLDLEARNKLNLKNWNLEICGCFIFIKRNNDGINLASFLDKYYSCIQTFSKAIGEKIFKETTLVDINWKVILENTLEGYHVSSVHVDTFGKFNIESPEFTYDSYHSSYQNTSKDDSERRWLQIKRIFEHIEINKDIYLHQLIFPGLTFGFSQGISFFIQMLRPVSSIKTEITNYVFIGCLHKILSPAEEEIKKVFSNYIGNFYRQIFIEDRQICEKIQRGITSINIDDVARYKGVFSNHEQRIYSFHQSYLNLMQ
jgi:phenylpropionate dioxygenase-like ring-hydroxylating dioxygenase large terminal subunit